MQPTIIKLIFSVIIVVFSMTLVNAQADTAEKFANMIAKGENAAALTGLKSHLKKNKTDHLGWYFLGIANINLLKERDAIKALNNAVKLKADDVNILSTLAYAHMLSNSKQTEKIANETLKLAPNNVTALYVLSVAGLRQGNYVKA